MEKRRQHERELLNEFSYGEWDREWSPVDHDIVELDLSNIRAAIVSHNGTQYGYETWARLWVQGLRRGLKPLGLYERVSQGGLSYMINGADPYQYKRKAIRAARHGIEVGTNEWGTRYMEGKWKRGQEVNSLAEPWRRMEATGTLCALIRADIDSLATSDIITTRQFELQAEELIVRLTSGEKSRFIIARREMLVAKLVKWGW